MEEKKETKNIFFCFVFFHFLMMMINKIKNKKCQLSIYKRVSSFSGQTTTESRTTALTILDSKLKCKSQQCRNRSYTKCKQISIYICI